MSRMKDLIADLIDLAEGKTVSHEAGVKLFSMSLACFKPDPDLGVKLVPSFYGEDLLRELGIDIVEETFDITETNDEEFEVTL